MESPRGRGHRWRSRSSRRLARGASQPAARGAGREDCRDRSRPPRSGLLDHANRRDRRALSPPGRDDGSPSPGCRTASGRGAPRRDGRPRPAGEPRHQERSRSHSPRAPASRRGGAQRSRGARRRAGGTEGDARLESLLPRHAGPQLRRALSGDEPPAVRRERGGPGGRARRGGEDGARRRIFPMRQPTAWCCDGSSRTWWATRRTASPGARTAPSRSPPSRRRAMAIGWCG